MIKPQRFSRRYQVKLPAKYYYQQSWHLYSISNLSLDGCFIECETPPPFETVIALEIDLRDRQLKIKGVVRWTRIARENPEVTNGFGVKFVDMNHQDLEDLASYILYYL